MLQCPWSSVLCSHQIHLPWCAELFCNLESTKQVLEAGYIIIHASTITSTAKATQWILADPGDWTWCPSDLSSTLRTLRSKLIMKGKHVNIHIFSFLLLRRKYFETSNVCNPKVVLDSGNKLNLSHWLIAAEQYHLRDHLGEMGLLQWRNMAHSKNLKQTVSHQIMRQSATKWMPMPLVVTLWG